MLGGDFKNVTVVQARGASDNQNDTLQVCEFRGQRDPQLGPCHGAVEVQVPGVFVHVVAEPEPLEKRVACTHWIGCAEFARVSCGDEIVSALFLRHHENNKFLGSSFFKAGVFCDLEIEELGELARGYSSSGKGDFARPA